MTLRSFLSPLIILRLLYKSTRKSAPPKNAGRPQFSGMTSQTRMMDRRHRPKGYRKQKGELK